MACYNCAKSFSFLTKEKVCKNCGFTFCSGCLKYKAPCPKTKSDVNVCGACYRLLTAVTQTGSDAVRSSPDALERRLDALQNLPPNPITIYKESDRLHNLKSGMSVEDKAIAERLGKLQRDRKASMNVPTDAEIFDRLAKLKGRKHESSASNYGHLSERDNRTQIEKSDHLLLQMQEELNLERKIVKPEDDIAARLAKLKGKSPRSPSSKSSTGVDPSSFLQDHSVDRDPINTDNTIKDLAKLMQESSVCAETDARSALQLLDCEKNVLGTVEKLHHRTAFTQQKEGDKSSSDCDDEEVEKVICSILAEQKLDEDDVVCSPTLASTIREQKTSITRQIEQALNKQCEELPWCVICNDDATIRCGACNDDLYCQKCFNECHDQFDLEDHIASSKAFKPSQQCVD